MVDSQQLTEGLFGKYRLERRLAFGGMAEIFLASMEGEHGFAKRLVLKRILPQYSNDTDFIAMFVDEAVLAAKLTHPNVAQIYDFGREGDHHYIAMEYVEGLDLKALQGHSSQRNIPFTAPVLAALGEQICKGLHYVHAATGDDGQCLNIIHRDVSPHNVMVSCGGTVKVMDFGIAKAATRATQTATGVIKGKLAYMAPEHAAGKHSDQLSDQFAVGILLWEMWTGQRYYQADLQPQLLYKVIEALPRPIAETRPGIPLDLQRIISKSLERDPTKRYANLGEMARELSQFRFGLGLEGAVDLAQWYDALAPKKASAKQATEQQSNGQKGQKKYGTASAEPLGTAKLPVPVPEKDAKEKRGQGANSASPRKTQPLPTEILLSSSSSFLSNADTVEDPQVLEAGEGEKDRDRENERTHTLTQPNEDMDDAVDSPLAQQGAWLAADDASNRGTEQHQISNHTIHTIHRNSKEQISSESATHVIPTAMAATGESIPAPLVPPSVGIKPLAGSPAVHEKLLKEDIIRTVFELRVMISLAVLVLAVVSTAIMFVSKNSNRQEISKTEQSPQQKNLMYGSAPVSVDIPIQNDTTTSHNMGQIKISSDPSGAEVLLDGLNTGLVTPITIPRLPLLKSINIVLRRTGYKDFVQAVTLTELQHNIHLVLKKKSKPVKNLPAAKPVTNPLAELVASNVAPSVVAAAPRKIKPKKAKKGLLSLRSSDIWADVYLGKRKLGTTPLSRVSVPAGKYSLRLVNKEAGVNRRWNIVVDANKHLKQTVFLLK